MRPRYLRPALTMPQIYLYRAPIDFRKQAHGLAALVEQQLGHNPFTGAQQRRYGGELWGVHKEASVVAWCLKEFIADRRGWKHC